MPPSNIHKGKRRTEENFEVRDIETKKVEKRFRSPNAAKMYLTSLPFGLKNYYEIYNISIKKVIYQYIKYGDGNNGKQPKR